MTIAEIIALARLAGGGSGGGSGSIGGGLFKVTITGTPTGETDEYGERYKYTSDKKGKEVYDAFMSGLLPYAEIVDNEGIYFNFIPCVSTSDQYQSQFIGVTSSQSTNNDGKILVSIFNLNAKTRAVSYEAFILSGWTEGNCGPFSTLYN